MMAKRNREEEAKVLMVRTPQGFRPLDGISEENLMHVAIGAVVECQIWQDRSPEHHRLYWAVLGQCVDNSENRYGSSKDLHSALKIALGYTHRVKMIGTGQGGIIFEKIKFWMARLRKFIKVVTMPAKWRKAADEMYLEGAGYIAMMEPFVGDTLVLPGSISFSKMDQAEFKVFFDCAMDELRKAEYPVDAFIEEGKKKMAPSSYPKTGERHGSDDGRRGEASRRGDQQTQGHPEGRAA
jgi:Protein of unknown function (DUF1367)